MNHKVLNRIYDALTTLRPIPKKKSRKDDILFYVTIFGTILSTFFAGWAIRLTLNDKSQQNQIDSLSSIIRRLDTSNLNLGSLVTQSGQTYIRSGKQLDTMAALVKKMDTVISTLLEQNKTQRSNSAPKIKLDGPYEFVKTNEKKWDYRFEFTNIGTRTAKETIIKVFIFYTKEDGSLELVEGSSKLNSIPKNIVTNERAVSVNSFSSNVPISIDILRGLHFKVVFKFKDELSNKYQPDVPFYYSHKINDDFTVNFLMDSSPEMKKIMDKLSKGQ